MFLSFLSFLFHISQSYTNCYWVTAWRGFRYVFYCKRGYRALHWVCKSLLWKANAKRSACNQNHEKRLSTPESLGLWWLKLKEARLKIQRNLLVVKNCRIKFVPTFRVIVQWLWPLQVFECIVKSSITDVPYIKNYEKLRFCHIHVEYVPKWI